MSDRHKGPKSLDLRAQAIFNRLIRPRLGPLLILTLGYIIGDWYAHNWTTIVIRANLGSLHINPDLIMGLLAALFYGLGAAIGIWLPKLTSLQEG